MANTRRVLQNVPASLSVTLVNGDGEARPPLGPVTVSIVRGNGDSLVESRPADAGIDVGVVTVDLSAEETAQLDRLTATWTEQNGGVYVTTADVVGGYYFSLDEVRQASPGLNDTGKYSTAMLVEIRAEVEEEAERITGRAFVPRYGRVEIDNRYAYRLPAVDVRRVRSLSIDGVNVPASVNSAGQLFPLTAAQVANAGPGYGRLGSGVAVVEYEYGVDAPPADLKRAALLRMVSRLSLAKTGVPDRAEYQVIDGKFFTVTQPGVRGSSTGIREVDAVYHAYAISTGVVAVSTR